MAARPAHEPIPRAGAQRLGGGCVGGQSGRKVLCFLLVFAGIAAPVYAAEPSGGDADGGAGYYGPFYDPGKVPAASTTAPGEAVGPTEPPPRRHPGQYEPPDAGGLLYQPGFGGCAPSPLIATGAGLRSALVPLPRVPQQDRGRYLRLGLSVAQIHTDNVGLEDDEDAEGDYVTQVVPSLEACANSGRIKASVDYRPQALYYADQSELSEIYQNVSATTSIAMLPGHLFLDADSSYGQAVVDPSAVFSENNVLRPDNRTSAWLSNVSPYWFQRLGSVGQATLRYRHGWAEYGSSQVPDYRLQGVYFYLSNPPTRTLWSYVLSVASQRVERDEADAQAAGLFTPEDEVSHFDSATFQLGYRLTGSLELLALGGVENDYHSDGSVDRWGSAIWDLGFRWSSSRNSLEATYGQRSFGPTFSFAATHRAPTFDLSLAYREDTTAAGLNQINRGSVGGGGVFASQITPLRDRGVFVRKRLSVALGFDTARTRTTLQAYDESREFLTSDAPDEDVYGVELAIRYQLGVRTALLPRASWEQQSFGQEEADIAELGIAVRYLLTASSLAALGYSHRWRDAQTRAGSYEENRIVLQYSVYF